MKDSTPIRTASRSLSYALKSELERLVSVRKKDEGLRVCVDYRGINKRTILDCYLIPRIDDLVDTIGRCHGKIFAPLHLLKGYHQIKMASEFKEKTAYICHLGLFQYRHIPFGLTNAPGTFQ